MRCSGPWLSGGIGDRAELEFLFPAMVKHTRPHSLLKGTEAALEMWGNGKRLEAAVRV